MDEPIKVGDLVAIVRCCCTGYLDGHSVFVVARIEMLPLAVTPFFCSICDSEIQSEPFATEDPATYGCPVSWLKRIPPLDELEGEQRREEITA